MKTQFRPMGQFLYNIVLKATPFFVKHKWLYYILIFTWGLPYSIIGLLSSLILIITGHKPHKYYLTWYIYVLKGWGGASLGSNFLVGHDCNGCRSHEMGHTIQVAIFGVFFYFLVAIPSFLRYWYITIKEQQYQKRGLLYHYDYDAIWFEGSATDAGKLIEKISLNK